MSTRIREHTARSRAGRTWLLALVVVGIVGMHGLSAGGGHGAHADQPSGTVVSGTVVEAHAGVAHGAPEGAVAQALDGGASEPSFVMLCIVMVLALTLGMTALRRTSWVASPARARNRLTLPAAPLLRDRTPVPRFTVMRC